MAFSNIPMPSFTLVLTTGHRSHRRHPSNITFDILSNAPDRLMNLRDELEGDDHGHHTDVSTTSIGQEGIQVDLPAIANEAELPSPGSIEKEASHPFKAYLLLFPQKLLLRGKLAFLKKIFSSR